MPRVICRDSTRERISMVSASVWRSASHSAAFPRGTTDASSLTSRRRPGVHCRGAAAPFTMWRTGTRTTPDTSRLLSEQYRTSVASHLGSSWVRRLTSLVVRSRTRRFVEELAGRSHELTPPPEVRLAPTRSLSTRGTLSSGTESRSRSVFVCLLRPTLPAATSLLAGTANPQCIREARLLRRR